MSTTAGTTAPRVDDAAVRFQVTDPTHQFRGVRLWQEVGLPKRELYFAATSDGWVLQVDRPPVDRMEYLLEVRHSGGAKRVLDAANPNTVPGVSGRRSVVEFPGYRTPWWLTAPCQAGSSSDLTVSTAVSPTPVPVRVWSPAGVADGDALPLVVAHDGPEYDRLGRLTGYAAALVHAGVLPPHRVALLAAGDRDDWYSANPAYATALCASVLPAIRREVRVVGRPVGLGVSLGALAMLHAERRYPGSFAALFLQSGSFFVPVYDHMEAGFARFGRVVRWVSATRRAGPAAEPTPVVLTCGAVEANLRNNRIMRLALARQQYAVTLVENRDAHNYTGWRDCLDPYLTQLLHQVWHAA